MRATANVTVITRAVKEVSRCPVCGASLASHRADATYCSNACRAEAWRLRRLLAGSPVGRYTCLADRIAAYGRGRRSSRSQEAREAA